MSRTFCYLLVKLGGSVLSADRTGRPSDTRQNGPPAELGNIPSVWKILVCDKNIRNPQPGTQRPRTVAQLLASEATQYHSTA